ncbi:beta-N-acetyl-D-glucosaminide beta-1,4-N-acetylglucosaminyl-transferase, partial [Aplysia californica]|uniref:Beta-N-acetyl-D-glucosaminide beta-1,4-N-acetylglucosaminyl-transferase n=1 Tax=Aplysia californica TaxID=6500 RepID=A0ABM0ZWA5_APLCA
MSGGSHRPQSCRSAERLAIIIPYRNRFEHLHILLNTLIPLLVRQLADFRIFVIDQDMPTTFNRGMLFNVGFLEAEKIDNFDCFIFHDVDMLPLNDHCFYRCSSNPKHLTAAVSKWKYSLPYEGYFGGVVAFTKSQFKHINGDSNLYFGWGGEDDDLKGRVKKMGYTRLR